MEKKNCDSELEKLIRASMELEDIPSPELNRYLKARLYQREEAMRQQAVRVIPLWFAPMLLNLVTFTLLSVFALLCISNPYLAGLAVSICAYMGLAGILITVVGAKRTDMKETVRVHLRKRDVMV